MKTLPDNKPTESGLGIVLWLLAFLVLCAVWFFLWHGEVQSQEVAPTPANQENLSEWWDWCLAHPNVLWRESKKYKVSNHYIYCEERLKVPGPPWKTPFGSMSLTWLFTEKYNNSGFAGLNHEGFNFQTYATTGIGEGQWTTETWGGGE